MRVLVLGGTGLTGPFIVRDLLALGHEVTVFHRGRTAAALSGGANEVLGDLAELAAHRDAFESLKPDVVISMMTLTRADAKLLLEVFTGVAGRAVVVSSGDVYLAYGRALGSEPGPLIEGAQAEDAPLRTKLSLGGEGYDKLGVETLLGQQTALPVTIVRYPAVYGPGDHQRRFFREVKAMADDRPAIVLPEGRARWRFSHGYCEDVAQAVILAATRDEAAGRTYNVGELETPITAERLEQLAAVAGWSGRIVVAPDALFRDPLGAGALKDVPGYVAPPDFRQPILLDSGRIRRELGYVERVEPPEGYRRTIEWLLANLAPEYVADYIEEDEILERL